MAGLPRVRRALGDLRARFDPSVEHGEPAAFLDRRELELRLFALPPAPVGAGTVRGLVVRAPDGHLRVDRVRLDPAEGVVGDGWARGKRNPDAQVSVMRLDVAELLANGQPVELAGDNLLVELDLSPSSLSVGATVRVGEALCRVTPKAHTGCYKFKARFGGDALAIVNAPDWLDWKLRGLFLQVVEGGAVAVGDPIGRV